MRPTIHTCPIDDCKTHGRRTRLAVLGARDPATSSWASYTDPVDRVQILRCPKHGRFFLAPGATDPVKELARSRVRA